MSGTKKKSNRTHTKTSRPHGVTRRDYAIVGAVVLVLLSLIGLKVASTEKKPPPAIKIQSLQPTAIPTQARQEQELPTPTPLSYDNWQTYQNDAFHFSVSYQGTQSQIEKMTDNNNQIEKPFVDATSLPYTSYWMMIIIWKNYDVNISDIDSFNTWCKKSTDDYFSANEVVPTVPIECEADNPILSTQEINISGNKAYNRVSNGQYDLKKWVFIPHGNYVYEISFTKNVGYYQKEEFEQTREAANYALSTFKFL